jgi:hypothetical protein
VHYADHLILCVAHYGFVFRIKGHALFAVEGEGIFNFLTFYLF